MTPGRSIDERDPTPSSERAWAAHFVRVRAASSADQFTTTWPGGGKRRRVVPPPHQKAAAVGGYFVIRRSGAGRRFKRSFDHDGRAPHAQARTGPARDCDDLILVAIEQAAAVARPERFLTALARDALFLTAAGKRLDVNLGPAGFVRRIGEPRALG